MPIEPVDPSKEETELAAGVRRYLSRRKEHGPRETFLKANPVGETELSDISESGPAKGLRNYGRMYKQGLGMKPETPYEYKKGGSVSSASARADGCAIRGKTRA
jgi:hypothetical protein